MNSLFPRMEKLQIGTNSGMAKVLGTALSVSGAMIITFYKGVEIKIWPTSINLLSHYGEAASQHMSSHQALGAVLATSACLSLAIWMIVQAKMSMVYPPYSGTALMCACASVLSIVYAMSTEKDWSAWKLGWNINLLISIYFGVLGTALNFTLMSWVARIRGPLYVSSFYPLMLIIVAAVASLLLGEKLYLGSILGALLIIPGLYSVLWGKSKDMRNTSQVSGLKGSRHSELGDAAVGTSLHDSSEADATSLPIISVQVSPR